MLKKIDIQDLKPGMVIKKITEQNGPLKIKKSGLVTSKDMVQGLVEMGVLQVEIDPDQTVEVSAPLIKKSTTRRMLESNKITYSQDDDEVSEHYNRTLFLPSVQSIPAPWQIYAKRYLIAVFVAIVGLGFGWSLGNDALINMIFGSDKAPTVENIVDNASPTATPDLQQPASEEPTVKQAITQQAPSQQQVSQPTLTQPIVNQQVAAASVKEPENLAFESQSSNSLPDSAAIESEQAANNASLQQQLNTQTETESNISADMLARFRKAVTEVESSPIPEPPLENLPDNDEVPRVDQLPAWAMSQLPSMAFSAHMYASQDSERWVRVNGTRMVEGDKIDGLIEIIRIEPQRVILNYSGQTFSMAALTDW